MGKRTRIEAGEYWQLPDGTTVMEADADGYMNFSEAPAIGGTQLTVDADDLNTLDGLGAILGGTTCAADVLAIPVTHRYVAKTTGADAEALTLANGIAGQRLNIALVVDGGGSGTLTPTTKSGFATIVFADAGDIVDLEYVDDTTGWVLVGSAGVLAPPVITV